MGKLKQITMSMGSKETPWHLTQTQLNTLLRVRDDSNLTKKEITGYVFKDEITTREKYLLQDLGLNVSCRVESQESWSVLLDKQSIAPGESSHIILTGGVRESEVNISAEYSIEEGSTSLSIAKEFINISGTTITFSSAASVHEFLLRIKLTVSPLWEPNNSRTVVVKAGTAGTVALKTTFNVNDYSSELPQEGSRSFLEDYISKCKCYVFDAFGTKKAEIKSATFVGDHTGMQSGDVTFTDNTTIQIEDLLSRGCNFMVLRPQLYFKVEGNILKFFGTNAVVGAKSWNRRYIGMFKGFIQNNILKSQPNRIPTTNKSIAQFQEAAKRGGKDYGLWNFNDWCRENAIHLSYFKNTNYEHNVGVGRIRNFPESLNIVTGFTLPLIGTQRPYGTVSTYDSLGRSTNCLNFFNIEGLGEQVGEFVLGFRCVNSTGYVWEDNVWNESHMGDWTFQIPISHNHIQYIKSIIGGEHFNVFAAAIGGSSTTGYCDGCQLQIDSRIKVIFVGGDCRISSMCGMSSFEPFEHLFGRDVASSRLAFRGDPPTVEGSDLL